MTKTNTLQKKKKADELPNTISIKPSFSHLTPQGVEMFKNMGDIETAGLFLDDLVAELGDDHVFIAGIMALLQAIRVKAENRDEGDKDGEHPVDFISSLQTHLFNWTWESCRCVDVYINSVVTGNFTVEKLVVPKKTEAEVVNVQGE